MKHTLLYVLFSLLTLSFISQAHAGTQFNNPTWNGYALDWCRVFENACGAPAADQYCQKRGYPRAEAFQIRPRVNVQTMTIGNNAICNPNVHGCDSFQYIVCQETTKQFNYPSWNGYRLDWCSQFENGCGQQAAKLYCQKRGYSQLVNFAIQNQLNVQTMTVGSNAICNPQYHRCDGFSYITCKK